MSNSKVLLGFVAGAAVGALAGILFAPDKGSSTRKKIAGKAGDITDSIKNSFGSFVDGIKNTYSHAKDEAEELGDKAKAKLTTTRNEIKNTLSGGV
jgi:gas vesicle protein